MSELINHQWRTTVVCITDVKKSRDRICINYEFAHKPQDAEPYINSAKHIVPSNSQIDPENFQVGSTYLMSTVKMNNFWYIVNAVNVDTGENFSDRSLLALPQFKLRAAQLNTNLPKFKFQDPTGAFDLNFKAD